MSSRALLFLSCGFCLAALPARSATWVIRPDGAGDFATLADAIAGSGDGDVLELTDGTFTGDGNRDLWIYDAVRTIRSRSGDPSTCILDAEGGPGVTRRIFGMQGTGPGFVLENLTLTRGTALDELSSTYGGALMLQSGASPTITGCVFTGNDAGRGGAIFALSGSAPVITDCLFVDNHATSYGGAVSLDSGCDAVITHCIFDRNRSDSNGGALNVWNGGAPTISYCTFYGNSAPDGGAVAWCRWGGAPSFTLSILSYSTAGSAVSCDGGAAPSVLCSLVHGNAGGDWVDCIAVYEAVTGNLSDAPLFCDAEGGDFTLQTDSPCLPENSGACDQVGCLGLGPCALPVDAMSWGRLKGGYR